MRSIRGSLQVEGHPQVHATGLIKAQELQCLVEAGMSPMQALQAATGHAASCLGLERDIGTIAPGKVADLVVVQGDPLHDITLLQNPQRIALVLQGGNICVDRRGSDREGKR